MHPRLYALKKRLNLRSRLRRYGHNAVELTAQQPLGTISRVRTRQPVVALTFDDGPHPEYTPRLLELLERHGARGTFFVIGEQAARHPAIVARAAAAGHAIGNHTWDHPAMPTISAAERREQIRRCRTALGPYGSRLFRPPYGLQTLASRIDPLREGYEVIGWSFSAFDWLDRDGPWMAEFIGKRLAPGKIVILHDRLHTAERPELASREAMLEAVDLLLQRHAGTFRFVTVPELLKAGTPWRTHWYREPRPEWLSRQAAILDEPGPISA
jgi:peptidoglycan/xylan/chitin deacetylase (PgdA/CDA1 family)